MCVKVMWMTHFSIQLIYLIDCSIEPTLWGPRFDHRRPPQLSVLLTSRYLKVRRLKEKVLFYYYLSSGHNGSYLSDQFLVYTLSLSSSNLWALCCSVFRGCMLTKLRAVCTNHHPLPTEKAAISCNLWWYFLHKKEAIISFLFSLLTECNLGKKACYKHSISP